MSIWGLIIGGTAGFAIGGPIGALLGAAAGHAVTARLTYLEKDPDSTKKVVFTVAVIALSAKMAKAEGIVTRDEISAFRRHVDISPSEASQVGRFWDLARQTKKVRIRQTGHAFEPRVGARTALRFAVSYSQIGRKDNTR